MRNTSPPPFGCAEPEHSLVYCVSDAASTSLNRYIFKLTMGVIRPTSDFGCEV